MTPVRLEVFDDHQTRHLRLARRSRVVGDKVPADLHRNDIDTTSNAVGEIRSILPHLKLG